MSDKQKLTKLEQVDRGLWRMQSLAEIGCQAALNDLVCATTLSHLLEEIQERCDQLHDLTQELEAEAREREKQRQDMQEALKCAVLDAAEKVADGGVL